MLEKQDIEVLDRAPHVVRNLPKSLVAWAHSSIKTPRRLLRGAMRRGKRLWLARRVRRLGWATRMRANRGVCSIDISDARVGFFA